ncbi:MFS transporter [Streptomyces sp. URMC 124]|uniref:MFS transporter n=1 Tax=Streptomyces sp. URMC 124 TaxID=3423405 RepID=UPI003F1B5261
MTSRSEAGARSFPKGLVLAASLGFVVCLLGSALKNTVQVYFEPMAETFGQHRGSFALATTVFAVTYAFAAPLTGMLADRIGPARVLMTGTCLAGVSLLLCANLSAFPAFVAVYGVLVSFAYTMLSYVPIGVLVDRLFSDGKKGFFYALLTNGTAAGFMLLVPLWTWLGHHTDWQYVLDGLGVLLLVVIAPLTVLLARRMPARAPAARAATAPGGFGARWRMVVGSSVLWRLAGAFFACGATMAFIDVHMLTYLSDMHVDSGVSSLSLVLLGICEIIGSLIAGRLCDRGFIKRVLVGGYALRAISMFLIAVHPNATLVLVFGVLFGASYLVTVVATSVWVLRVFPVEVKGVVMGLIWTAHQIGAALSSQLGGMIFDREHSYVPLIITSGCVAVFAMLLVATLPSPGEPPATTPAVPPAADPVEEAA